MVEKDKITSAITVLVGERCGPVDYDYE